MGSVDARKLGVVAACALSLAGLSACGQTTMDQNVRLGLRNDRTVESRKPIRVGEPHPDVEVVDATVLRGDEESAVAVKLRNTGDEIVNDLPILLTVGGEAVNSTTKTSYFQGHAPVIAPGGEATWVFTTKQDLPDGEADAVVGEPKEVLIRAASVPEIAVSHSERRGTVTVDVENANDFPQYDLDVYAWGEKGGRIVAAGRGSIEHIGSGGEAELTLKLVGDPEGSEIRVAAPATFFE